MLNPSWDDSGLHNQVWMMSFINSAEFSWSGSHPSLDEFSREIFSELLRGEFKRYEGTFHTAG